MVPHVRRQSGAAEGSIAGQAWRPRGRGSATAGMRVFLLEGAGGAVELVSESPRAADHADCSTARTAPTPSLPRIASVFIAHNDARPTMSTARPSHLTLAQDALFLHLHIPSRRGRCLIAADPPPPRPLCCFRPNQLPPGQEEATSNLELWPCRMRPPPGNGRRPA